MGSIFLKNKAPAATYLYDHPTGDKEVAGRGVGATMHHFKSGDYL